jgi:hypothetical protein
MLRSLIVQLSGRRPDSPKVLLDLRRLRDINQHPDLKSLEATLQATTEGFEKVFLVIDALDECPENNSEREILLKLIDRIQGWSSSSLHFLCTSRKENDIERAFQPLLQNQNASTIDLKSIAGKLTGILEFLFSRQSLLQPSLLGRVYPH